MPYFVVSLFQFMNFDGINYLIVGSGFFGSVLAERITTVLNEKVAVIEKRNHIGGNCYSEIEPETNIEYHAYGSHIFHTSNPFVWEYINRFTEFNNLRFQVLTTHKNKVYQLPINLETINSFYQINLKPFEVIEFLNKEISKENIEEPKNFEELAISQMGRPLYEAFIKGYTQKQWQKDPKDMPMAVLKRLPFRTNYNENYYFDTWQGIPLNGYTAIFEKMLQNKNIDLYLNTDFFDINHLIPSTVKIIYSGAIDRYFNYCFGKLDWRSLDFQKEIVPYNDYQGNAIMNFADLEVPYTRIHEPKHLHPERDYTQKKSLIIKEYSKLDDGSNPYYPINDKKNQELVKKYRAKVAEQENLIVAGRLGDYKYYDMDNTIARALEVFEQEILATNQ